MHKLQIVFRHFIWNLLFKENLRLKFFDLSKEQDFLVCFMWTECKEQDILVCFMWTECNIQIYN